MEWTAAVVLVFVTVVIASSGARETARQALRTGLCTAAALVTALAWFAAGSGTAGLGIGAGEAPPFAVAWILSIPLLLAALSITAAPLPRVRRAVGGDPATADVAPVAGAMLAAGAVMVLAHWIALASEGAVAWVWLVALLALLAVTLFTLWDPLRDASEEGHPLRAETYLRHAAVLSVFLAAYPLVLLGALSGVLSDEAAVTAYALLDLAAIGGFALYVVLDDKRLAEIETEDGTFPPVIPRAARETP